MPRDDININTERIVHLSTGDGPARVGIGMGFTRQVGDVWLKPQIYIEVEVPSSGDVDNYLEYDLKPYIQFRLFELFEELKKINGIDTDG